MSEIALSTEQSIGQQIRSAREARGLSREALARDVDISTATVTRLEREDHLPNVRSLARITVALGLSLDELLTP